MEFSLKLHLNKSGSSIINIEGSNNVQKSIVFLSLKIHFEIAKGADTDEMLHYAAGSSLFAKVPI